LVQTQVAERVVVLKGAPVRRSDVGAGDVGSRRAEYEPNPG
jgi:hypothetical protein